ncbi:hypothetical protein V6Z12_D02G206900 [Gossypium hirsutum]
MDGILCKTWERIFFFISIPFPLHRLPIRCLKNPILSSPNSHLKNTLMIAISCFLRLRYYSPSYKVRPERHHQWNLLILLVKKSFIYLISSEADSVHVSLLTTFFPLFLDAMFTSKEVVECSNKKGKNITQGCAKCVIASSSSLGCLIASSTHS